MEYCQLYWTCRTCIGTYWYLYSFGVWYNLYCKTGKGGRIVLIETRIYKCEYCGAEFDDEYEANCHEWLCRYKDVKNCDGSNLRFYKEDGTEIKFDDVAFVWADFDNDVYAFTVGNESDIKFVKELFNYCGFGNPFPTIINEANLNYYSLYYGTWWFDADMYHGTWVRVDDQIKKWTDIKNKFEKGT